MKDGNAKQNECTVRELSDIQADVLDELRDSSETGVTDMYLRALSTLKTRLIMDDDYDPSENLSLARVVTMLERDLRVLCGREPDEDATESLD